MVFRHLRRQRAALAPVAEAIREHAHVQDWRPFVLGYEQALRDIESTGLRPLTDRTMRDAAERAFRRIYIVRRASNGS